jgi:hypothetical protein
MIVRVPPPLASWLLKHFYAGYRGESLAGDLFEEYQRDRTAAWYWRQTAAAILIGALRGLHVRLPRLVVTVVLRILIELGIVSGGIALAQSKATCPPTLSACRSDLTHDVSKPAAHEENR